MSKEYVAVHTIYATSCVGRFGPVQQDYS